MREENNLTTINQQLAVGNMRGRRDARNFLVMRRLEMLEQKRVEAKAKREDRKRAAGQAVNQAGRRLSTMTRAAPVMDIASIAVLAQLRAKRKELRWRPAYEYYSRLCLAWAFQFFVCGVAYWYAIICAISFGNNQTTAFIVSWLVAYGWTFAIVEPAQVLIIAGTPCLCDEETRLGRCCLRVQFVYNELFAP